LQRIVLLQDRASGKGMTFSIWETEEQLRATESSGYLQEQLGKLAGLFTAPPEWNSYEVAAWDKATPPVGAARTIGGAIQPAKLDEFLGVYSDILGSAKLQAGYRGAVLLIDRAGGKVFSATAWATEDDVRASEANLRANMGKVVSLGIGQPSVESYAVVAMV